MTSADVWYPDRASIVETLDAQGLIHASCACGSDAIVSAYVDVQAWRRQHRCPPGSVGAWPQCPECGSTTRACLKNGRTRGRGLRDWHTARRLVYEEVTGRPVPNIASRTADR